MISIINKDFVISFSFGNYLKADGGVDKVIAEHQKIFNNNQISYVQFAPIKIPAFMSKNNMYIYSVVVDGIYYGTLDENHIILEIQKLSKSHQLKGLHLHHLLKQNLSFLSDLIIDMNIQIYCFIHDYYSICTQLNLLKNSKSFCGATKKPDSNCNECQHGEYIKEHLNRMRNFIQKIKFNAKFVFPSELCKLIWLKTYEDIIDESHCKISAHQVYSGKNTIFPYVEERLRIAFIGRFDINKGSLQWKKFVDFVNNNNLPIDLYYFGFSKLELKNVTSVNVRVTKKNPDAMITALKNNKINCVFLWSVCPETYSYAYFESWMSNTFVLTNKDSGNIEYMTSKNKNGLVFNSINDLIDEIDVIKEKVILWQKELKYGPNKANINDGVLSLLDNCNFQNNNNKYKSVNLVLKFLITKLYEIKNKANFKKER